MQTQDATVFSKLDDIVISVNGQLTDPKARDISPLDRSFLYGDSLYEVIRTLHGKPFHMAEHMARLRSSAKLCRMELPADLSIYEKAILNTIEVSKKKHGPGIDFYCRLIVSRGIGRIGFAIENILTPPQYVVITFPLKELSQLEVDRGMRLKVADRIRNDPRALDPAMKSGNYLNSLLAYLECTSDKKFDDALLVNHEGFLTEGTTFNIFYIKGPFVVTPPLSVGILQGITRLRALELAGTMGLTAREVLFKKVQLYEADEVFVTSTLKGVLPVRVVDDVEFRCDFKKTLELRKLFEDWSRAHV